MTHDYLIWAVILINLVIFGTALSAKIKFKRSTSRELKKVLKEFELESLNERGTKVVRSNVAKILSGNELLKKDWVIFESGLFAMDPITEEPIYSSLDASEYFSVERLLEDSKENVSFSIWNAVPQVLTSVGIMGTFLSILLTLSGLNTDEPITESFIRILVHSLASGFVCSLSGIFLSVVFVIWEKHSTKDLGRLLSKLHDWLNRSFLHATSETILVRQSHILSNLSQDISNSISKGFNEMTGSLGTALADVMDDETKKTIKEGVASSFADMNSILKDIRGESKLLTEELEQLRTAKLEMIENIRSLSNDQKKIQDEINRQSSHLVENLAAFEKTLSPLAEVAKQVHATNELSERLVYSVQNVSDMSSKMQSSLVKSEEIANTVATRLGEQMTNVGYEYSGLVKSIETWAEKSNGSLSSNLENFDQSVASVMRQILALTNSFNTSLVGLQRAVIQINQGVNNNEETT